MNKTTTRISYCLGILLILLNYNAYAQHVDGSSQSNPIIVPQSLATAYFHARTDIVEARYAFAINGGSANLILDPFIMRKTNTELDFNLTSLNYSSYQGKVVEIQRQVLLANGALDPSNKNYYVYPFTPSVALSICDGKITARDNSNNDAGLKRTYELYQNGNLIGTPLDHPGSSFEFPYAIQAGLSYSAKIKIFSTGNRPGSNGFVYEGGSTSITAPTSPSLSANPSTVCSGKEVRLTAIGGGSYQWSSGSQTGSQISVYPTATTTYSVSVTQGAGCPAIVRSVTVTVRTTPTVSVGTSTPTICSGSGVQLRATGASNNTYNWSQANGDQSTFVGSTSGMIVNVQPIATTTYRVTVSDGQCEATAEQQITVNPSPSVSIDPIASPVNVGTSLTLFGRASGGTWPYTYRWSTNATTSSIQIIANTSTTYYLTVEDNKTCTAGAQVQVTVNPKPTVSISPVPNPICPGTSTPLNSTVSGGTTPYTYRWSTGATTANTNVAPTATTTYRLTVTDQQGKKDSTQVQVLVHPKPVPVIQGTQPNCAGQSTVLTASGGNTYLWTGGATTASIPVNPVQSTTYYVTVKNTYNCSAVDSFRVIVPAAIQLGYGLQNDQDCTPNNVTVVPSPLNAQAPLSYSMQRNGTTTLNPSLSNLTTDTFTLIVTDSKGCTASTLVSINEVAPLRITLSKEREHDCTPGNTKINMSTTGARGAVSYRLDGGEPYNFATYLNVPNGLHTVTAQDAFGCVASDTVRIAEDSLLVVAEPLIKHVTCPSGSDGSISLQVHGGTGTYYFNWSNLGSSTNVLSNIPRGSYTVTVVDSRNCRVIKTAEVNQPGDIGYGARIVAKDLTCYQSNDASLEFTVPFSGGTGPYTFNWSNGSTTNIASNLASGNYTLTITDALGCKAYYNSAVSQPSAINSSPQYTNHLDCISNNVRITVAATGGRGGYSYSLDGGPAQNSGIFTGQSNGAHQLVVKDSANCSKTFTIQVVEHVPFSLGYRLENNQDCIPNNTTIVPLPENAQGAISYILVRNSNININPSLSGLSTGAYTLSGTDSKGCSASVSVTINEKIPPLPIRLDTLTVCAGVPATMSVRGAPASGVVYTWTVPTGANNPGNVASFITNVAGVYSVVMTNANTGCSISAQGEVRHTPGPDPDLCCSQSICAGQSAFLSSNNYTPLSFAWSTGASTRGISVNPMQSTTYTLTVTDAAGCKGTAQVSVDILPKPSVRIDSVPPICSGDTLTLRAVVSSGAAPYVYYWGSGSSGSTFKVSPSSTSTYTVSITDANGCMASAQVLVPVRTRPSVELGADQIVCTGTNATLRADVLNGTAPFTYAWSNGTAQSLINVVPSTTTTYTVTVTDAIGCKSSDQLTVQVNPRPVLDLGSDTTICAGSSASLSANIIGGTAPFTYSWSNGSSASTLTVTPTSTSTYTLTVTDQKGCLASGSTTVNVLSRPSVSIGPDRTICVGSSTTLNATASSADLPLTYAWSTGASTSNLSISPSATTTYSVTVTDGRACSQIDTIIVVVNTTTAGISGNSSACVGQNTTLTATGGGTYLWSTGASTASIVVSPSTTTTYTVTVTNQGCADTATHVLNVSTTNLSLIAPNILNTTDCQTGNIAFEVKYTGSSTPGLEFRMNGGAWQSSPWFTNRSAGTYLIEGRIVTPTCILSLNSRSGSVTEASGSTVVSSITVLNATDCIANNAGIRVNLTQNVSAEYRLFPSPNWNTSNYFSRQSGRHIVEVRPRNSSVCMERDTIEFDEKTASITSVNITGHDDCVSGNLRIEVVASGTPQSGPFQYRLKNYNGTLTSPWQDSPIFISPANASAYDRVELKTSTGCIYTQTLGYGLSEISPLSLSITGLTYISGATDCIKGNTRVSITTSTGEGVSVSQWRINGGAWTWSPGFSGLGRDSIFVEVRAYDDTRSCEVGKKLFVNERSTPDITQLVLSQHEDCTLNNAQITTQSTGGTGTIRYKLNSGSLSTNPVFSNLGSGKHLVTVQDGNACQDTLSVRITEPALLAITTSKANEGDCTGGNASITISTTGARGILSYSLNGGTPQASNIFNNLSNGTYTVTAQDGVCTVSKSVSVTESGALIATPFKTGETDCVLGNTSVAVNVTGALSTLSYRLNGGTAQASNVFNNLSNSSHTISVQAAGGCSTSTTFTVNEPTPLSLGTPQIQAVKCYGDASGSIGLNVSGGVTPYTISWSNGAQGAFIQYLPAGTYTFTVTDSRGCTVAGAASVPSPSAFQVQLSNFVDVACHNGTTGAISTTITGGMSPYTYRWSNSATTTSISNIAAGNYGLTVTDANGCAATATGSLANPTPLLLRHALANEQDCIANNLSITALASGGRGNYSFSLNGGTPQASGLFTGKTAGSYTLTLQDGAGCSAVPLVLELSEAQPLGLSHQLLKDQDCITNNAEVVPIPSQAQGSVSYLIAPLGTNNFTNLLSGWGSGSYLLKATDNRSCTATDTVIIQEVSPPSLIAVADDTLSCDEPIAVLTATSATPLQYQWRAAAGTILSDNHTVSVDKPGTYILIATNNHACVAYDTVQIVSLIPLGVRVDTFPSTRCDSANAQLRIRVSNSGPWLYRIDTTAWDTSATFRNLAVGTYQLSIASALDTTCVLDTLVQIGSREICIDICAGDSILIGRPGINAWCMKWLPEDGLSNPDSSYTWVKPTQSTTYRLIITDDEGNILDSLLYKVTMCPQLSVSPTVLNLCAQENGVLTASGGTGTYEWRNENGNLLGTGNTFAPTAPGLYTVVQTSGAAAQSATAQVIRATNENLEIEASSSVLCEDSIVLSAAARYHNLVWKNGESAILSTASELIIRQAGLYRLQAEVGMGCTVQASINITNPAFGIALDQPNDTLDVADYHAVTDFYHSFSGTGHQTLGLPSPENKTTVVELDKGCYDCGAGTIEIRDSLLADSSLCHKTVRRAWIMRNECGRKAVAIQTLIIQDQKPPRFIDFPEDSLILVCGLPLPDETPRALDNSGRRVQVSLQQVEKIAQGFCDTLLILHWRALDSCGNDSIRKQHLLIKPDPEAPLGVGNPHPCGTPYQQPTLNQTLRQTLQAEDVIWMYGFPVRIWNVTGGAGTFSGNGLLTLPFQAQAVKVTFSNIQVNEDGKVLAGTMQAVRAPNQPTFRCPDPKEVDFCPTYTAQKDSIVERLRLEAGGFKDCLWQGGPLVPGREINPQFDPYGFDCKGNHRNGGTTNELGCTQSEMNDRNNSKCYGKIEPWQWLTAKDSLSSMTSEGTELANQVKDSIRDITTDILADLILELDEDYQIQKVECAGIRTATRNAFAALGLPDSTYVFGSKGQYVKEGMWRHFSSAPQVLNLSVSRQPGMEALEKKHVELYPCDKKEEELKTLHAEAGGLQQEKAKGELIQWLNDLIRRLPKDSVEAFQNRDRFKAWVKRQIALRATQNATATFNNTPNSGNTINGGFRQVEAPSRGQVLRNTTTNLELESIAQEMQTEALAQARRMRISQALTKGDEFIEGVHRAFYLQDIARQKSLNFFPSDTTAKDTGAVLLPIVIDKVVGEKNYPIILDNISFDAVRGGTLNAYLILPAPGGGGKDSVVFQALNIPFTPGGADYNNARLTLKCDAPMRLNDIAQLKLLADNQTYIEWNCDGFSKLNLAAEIEFCRNVLVPYEGSTLKPAPDSVRLKATLSTYITAWDDFTMGVNFSHPFGLSEEGGFLFQVSDAYIDMSSTKTPSDLRFPENYPFASAGDRSLWKGFYMKQFSIYLPQELDKSRAPRGISLTDMIIDDAGISVVASIPGPVVPLQDGNLDGWAFSIDSVLIKILRNKFSGAGFGGLINIPLLNSNTGDAISEEDCVRYTAMIEEQGRYTFSVQPATSKKIGMWFADVNIEKSSKVSVTYANRRFDARAVLNGTIKVNADQVAKIKIPELRFQGLTVSNTAPYFDPGTWDRPASSAGVKANFSGFSFGVDSVNVEGGGKPGLGFRVRLSIGPEGGGFAVEGGFKMKGRLDVSTGRQRWLPDGLEVKRFSVKGTIKEFIEVNGFVEHFTNKGKFGDGFWGGLDATMKFKLLEGTQLQAVGLFGTTTTPDSTKYFMVDVMGTLPNATPGFIRGFGGGVWNRMSARDTAIVLKAFSGDVTSFPIGQSLSGLKYEPDPGAGLGLKAAMKLSMSGGKFDALVSLNAQFNSGGGLDELSLNGFGTMLKKTTLDGNIDTTDAAILAGVKLKYSFAEKAFDGHLNVSINVPNALTGGGEAKIHFSDKKWFIHVGTPQNPVRVNFQVPLVSNIGNARMYLCLGSELPPPATLPSYFREMGISSAIAASSASSGGGGGVMFGVGLDIEANFDKLKPLYAHLKVNLGADLALIDYGNAICSSTGQQIGINGWYASGQVYAYLKASVGLKFKEKQFPIAELAVGAALQGKLPNPTFARGAIGGSYRILGGLVKGKFNLQFTLGQDCGGLQDEGGTEQSLEQNYQIIAALRPDEGTSGVETTAIPSADFRFPINSTLDSYDDNGNPIAYLVELDGSPTLQETVTQSTIPARAILSTDGRSLQFQPYDALDDSTRYTFIVKVKYSKNGILIGSQEKQVSFTTGATATSISPANIVASYPISGMQHFYPGEYASEEEFIELRQGQADLFKGSNQPKAILLGATGGELWQGAIQYNLASKRLSFNFPNEILRPGQCYTIEIRRSAQASLRADDNGGGTSLPPGLLTTLNFCTSNYQTFREKATAFAQGATRTVVGNQIVLTGNTEEFDELETGGGYGGKSFVTLETSLYNNQWYQTQKELLYKAYRSKWGDGAFQFVPRARNGAAPDQAVAWGGSKVLQFNVLMELLADFQDFRNQVRDYDAELRSKCTAGQSIGYASASPCSNCCVLPEFLPALLELNTPTPPNGTYPLRLSYGVPGKGVGSTANLSIYFGTIINPEARKEESK